MRRIAPVVMSSGVPSTRLTRWHPNPPLRSKHPKDEKESYRKRLNQRGSAQSPHSSGCLLRFAEADGFYDDLEKCEFFQRRGQETRTRSSKDDHVRVAGIGRQSLPRASGSVAHKSYCRSLGLYDWRRAVFGRTNIDPAAQFAVTDAVQEIDRQSNCEPDKKSHPGVQRKTHH
jgi:hypothetical protein